MAYNNKNAVLFNKTPFPPFAANFLLYELLFICKG